METGIKTTDNKMISEGEVIKTDNKTGVTTKVDKEAIKLIKAQKDKAIKTNEIVKK